MGRKMKEHNRQVGSGVHDGVRWETWRGANGVKLYAYTARQCWIDVNKVQAAVGFGWIGCGEASPGVCRDRVGVYAGSGYSDTVLEQATVRMAAEVKRQQDAAPGVNPSITPSRAKLISQITVILYDFAQGRTDSEQVTAALLRLVEGEAP